MFLPGILITIVTFPGVIVHELAHQFFCRLRRVAVFEVCYFRFGNPAGYVLHEIPRTAGDHLLIGIAPFFVNSLLGAIIALPGFIPLMHFKSAGPLDYFLAWLGLSITMHAFPSTGDAKGIWKALWGKRSSFFTKLIGAPVVGLIYLGALGSFFLLRLSDGVGRTVR